jgi:hypothetical protein
MCAIEIRETTIRTIVELIAENDCSVTDGVGRAAIGA